MNEYELDRYVTKAIENIISRIQAPANVLSYAVEPYTDYCYSVPFFIEVGDTFALISYLVDVITSGENISLKFKFDGVSFHDDEIKDIDTLKTILEGMQAVLDTIDTDNEIYI